LIHLPDRGWGGVYSDLLSIFVSVAGGFSMSVPISDIVMLSVLAASISGGLSMWWWLSQRARSLQYELVPMTALAKFAPKPANEVTDEAAPDSSIRIRVGAHLRAVDSK
jgi:hypothetical protein